MPGDFIAGSGGPPIVIITETGFEEVNNSTTNAESLDNSNEGSKNGDQPKTQGEMQLQKYSRRIAIINESFTDNPMYPFTVTEPATLAITLSQQDKRWSSGRFGDDSTKVPATSFALRNDRMAECMRYPLAIGFVVLKLSGLKMRVTEFKLKKIYEKSVGLQFANTNANTIRLNPGRYAIVPYTHQAVDRATEYALTCQYLNHQVEFEIQDVIAQRLIDEAPSDDEDLDGKGEDYEAPDDNDLLHYDDDNDDYSILSYEKVEDYDDDEINSPSKISNPAVKRPIRSIPPPKIAFQEPWEYLEDFEELGLTTMFHEVGDLARFMRNLKSEVRNLHSIVRGLSNSVTEQKSSTE